MAPYSSVFLSVWGVFILVLIKESKPVSWDEWWTYDGISGPAFWGLINPDWSLCNKGRRQSPVNLEPKTLLFDPNLQALQLDKHKVGGVLTNTGHGVVFTVDNNTLHPVNISGGPLSYRYQFHDIQLHYGQYDSVGSEHTVDGYAFPAEIQIYGFNSQLYNNYSDALHRAQGIVAVSLLLQVGDLSNPELRIFTDKLGKIKYGGEETKIQRFVVRELLPDTNNYMTYDGSTTMPACHETTTWIIINKPIYITKQQLLALRELVQGDERDSKAPLGNNFRPPQSLHHRPVRTNIDFNVPQALVMGLVTYHRHTGKHLGRLGLAEEPVCQKCKDEEDTLLHLIMWCRIPEGVGTHVSGVPNINEFNLKDVRASRLLRFVRKVYLPVGPTR